MPSTSASSSPRPSPHQKKTSDAPPLPRGLATYLERTGGGAPLVRVGAVDDGGDRGLAVVDHVQPGTALFTVPAPALLNVRTLGSSFIRPDLLPLPRAGGATRSARDNQHVAVVRADKDTRSPALKDDDERPQLLTSSQALALHLTLWRRRRQPCPDRRSDDLSDPAVVTDGLYDDRRSGFLDTLPETFPTHPLLWSILADQGLPPPVTTATTFSPFHSLLGGPTTLQPSHFRTRCELLPVQTQRLLEGVKSKFWRDWTMVRGICRSSLGRGGQIEDTSEDEVCDFLWAWLNLNTRCLYYDLKLRSHSNNLTLCPLLDMANHTSDPSRVCVVQTTPNGSMELSVPRDEGYGARTSRGIATEGMKRGEQVFISYGPHSNDTLFTEYGFVLRIGSPSAVTYDDDNEEPRGWPGNPYSEANVSDEVEALFEARGEEGSRKRAILEESGYWGDWTLHPHPAPAHPSHRLFPALRLLYLDLPGTANGVLSQDSRPGRPTHAKKPKGKAGDGAAAPLDRWYGTLNGTVETVDERNEGIVRQTLVRLCERVVERCEGVAGKLEQAEERERKAMTEGFVESRAAEEGLTEGWKMVRQLWEEDRRIALEVKRSVESGIEF